MSDWATTRRLTVEVLLAEGEQLHGELHLQARVAYRDGAETLLEMLNREEPFLALSGADGIIFVSKDQVAVVSCPPEIELDDPDRAHAATRFHFEVVLRGAARYQGWAVHELPPTHTRTLDYLNTSGRFFAVSTDAETRYVNRSHVCLVRPFD